ncbi:hypothetical protein [Enterococcus sp. AZ196]|uniref:hypothetical protein n=1 Tax=Enterococcus sp. AZ196 TaxID=2774659 RepID=UPI003D2BE7E2
MNNCIDLDEKRLRNASILILGKENDQLLGILSIETTDSNYVFTMDPEKMKRVSEAEVNRIISNLIEQQRMDPFIRTNETTNEQTSFDLGDLLFEKVILTS